MAVILFSDRLHFFNACRVLHNLLISLVSLVSYCMPPVLDEKKKARKKVRGNSFFELEFGAQQPD